MYQRRFFLTHKISIGLIGYGKTGKAVANILSTDSRFELRWIARRTVNENAQMHPDTDIPIIGMEQQSFEELFDRHPVDAIVDFSSPNSTSCSFIDQARGIRYWRSVCPIPTGNLQYRLLYF